MVTRLAAVNFRRRISALPRASEKAWTFSSWSASYIRGHDFLHTHGATPEPAARLQVCVPGVGLGRTDGSGPRPANRRGGASARARRRSGLGLRRSPQPPDARDAHGGQVARRGPVSRRPALVIRGRILYLKECTRSRVVAKLALFWAGRRAVALIISQPHPRSEQILDLLSLAAVDLETGVRKRKAS